MIWIEEVEVVGFGPFPALKVNFKPGFNFITGDNESGKTSLHSAIIAILFGLRNSDNYRREDIADFRGRIVLHCGNNQLEIQRSFSDDHVVVTRVGEKETTFAGRASPLGRSQDRIAYMDILQNWFGLDDENLFRSSIFVDQYALQVEPDREAGEKISRLITGSEELPYEEIGERILERYFSITKINPDGQDKRQPRELQLLEEEITKTERELIEAESTQQEYSKRREDLDATEVLLDQLDRATRKRRLKSESVAIDSEISMLEDQIEQRSSIEEQLSSINKFSIPQTIAIPAIGISIATLGGFILGFIWPSVVLFLGVLGYIAFKFFQHFRKQQRRKFRLEGQLDLFRLNEDLRIALDDAKKRLTDLAIEHDAMDQTPFDDLPESQRRRKEQDIRRQRLQLSERLAVLAQRMRSPETLRERIEELSIRREQLKQRSHALYLGYMMLKQATEDFKEDAFNRLVDCASEHFLSLTNGLYRQIQLDNSWQPFAITTNGHMRPFQALSSGTRDSLLLSLRLAVGQLLSKGKPLPLILDDPIVFMDRERRKLFVNRLRLIANEHQIILFTFDRRLLKKDDFSFELSKTEATE